MMSVDDHPDAVACESRPYRLPQDLVRLAWALALENVGWDFASSQRYLEVETLVWECGIRHWEVSWSITITRTIYNYYILKVKENFILIHNNIRQKQSTVLRSRMLWLQMCIIHIRRPTCNNLQNFAKFSRASVRLHSVRFVGINFCYPPAFCHWTAPSAPFGWAQVDLNYFFHLFVFNYYIYIIKRMMNVGVWWSYDIGTYFTANRMIYGVRKHVNVFWIITAC